MATRNEAAERLDRQIGGWIVLPGAKAHARANLSDALAEERRLGYEEGVKSVEAVLRRHLQALDEVVQP